MSTCIYARIWCLDARGNLSGEDNISWLPLPAAKRAMDSLLTKNGHLGVCYYLEIGSW